MKKLITIALLTLCTQLPLLAQRIYTCEYRSEADIKIYVVQYRSEADLIVYKCDYRSEVDGNKGLWYFVQYRSEADKLIYFVDYKSEADLKIYKRSGVSFVERQLVGYEDVMLSHCIGTISEMFDGNPPFRGRGAVAFAMNVAEILRAIDTLKRYNQ